MKYKNILIYVLNLIKIYKKVIRKINYYNNLFILKKLKNIF